MNIEETTLLSAFRTIAEYRSKYGEKGFELLRFFIEGLLKFSQEKQECPKCGHLFEPRLPELETCKTQ